MPKDSRHIHAEQRFRLSKTVAAPAQYVYEWLTDYRADDGKLSRSHARYKVVRVGDDRLVRIRIVSPVSGNSSVAVDLIRLYPPSAWHTDQIDETDLATVDYRVTRLAPKRSRIDVRVLERWMTPKYPQPAEYRKSTSEYWDHLVSALEKRYRSGKPAIG